MMLNEAIGELRRRNEPVPKPMRLPRPEEVAEMQAALGLRFHPDYEQLLLHASDVVVGVMEPATITLPASHTHLPKIVASARRCGVPVELFPICEDNADFYCLTHDGRVVFWSHNGWNPKYWPNLAEWICDVWLINPE